MLPDAKIVIRTVAALCRTSTHLDLAVSQLLFHVELLENTDELVTVSDWLIQALVRLRGVVLHKVAE